MNRYLLLAVFLLAVVGGGALIGLLTPPDAWFQQLNKPAFNPPGWLFGPVWTVLYILIALTGWRIWTRPDGAGLRGLWLGQMALNFLWSPVFFGWHSLGGALLVILALWLTIMAFITRAWSLDRPAALMFLPYGAWVSFATLLNASIWWLN